MTLNEYQLKPTLTADGRPWVQRCYVCNGSIDLLKLAEMNPTQRAARVVRVDTLVRHKRCYPPAVR